MHAWVEICHLLQSLPSRASYAVLAGESQAFFKHSSTKSISNSAILRNNYVSLLSELRTREEKMAL